MPHRPTYKRRKHRRREVSHGYEYQCNQCRLWLRSKMFGKSSSGRWGLYSVCVNCVTRNESKSDWRKKLNRKRHLREKAQERLADSVDNGIREVPKRLQHASAVRTEKLVSAVRHVVARYTDLELAAQVVGVTSRTFRRILNEGSAIDIGTADKIALELDDVELLDEYLPDWNRDGLKRCRECGTNVHPHKGKGLCRLCYHRDYYDADPNGIHKGRWSKRYLKCIGCGTTERTHAGNGYCTRCDGRIKSHGGLVTRTCVCGCGQSFELNDKRRVYYSGACKTRVHTERCKARGINPRTGLRVDARDEARPHTG